MFGLIRLGINIALLSCIGGLFMILHFHGLAFVFSGMVPFFVFFAIVACACSAIGNHSKEYEQKKAKEQAEKARLEAEKQRKEYEDFRKPENILERYKVVARKKGALRVFLNAFDDEYVTNAIYVAAKYGFKIENPEYYGRTETLRALMKAQGDTEELSLEEILAEAENNEKAEAQEQ